MHLAPSSGRTAGTSNSAQAAEAGATGWDHRMNDTAYAAGWSSAETKPSLAISARSLVKRFGELRAVDGIDLEVPRGMIFAILGPNGAGKTTLMRMLATLTAPDAGSATVMGHDVVAAPHEVRGAIAMTGQL